MPHYKLLTFEHRGFLAAGLWLNGAIYEISRAARILRKAGGAPIPPVPGRPLSTLEILQDWDYYLEALNAMAERLGKDGAPEDDSARFEESEVRICAPILYPHKVLNAGANYWKHNREMLVETFEKVDRQPFFFYKGTANVIIGHNQPIILPRVAEHIDWECELAVVIGRRAKDVPASRALDVVAGYTVINDISARDKMVRPGELFFFDWFANKGNDTFAPMGPAITPRAFIPDPQALRIRCMVNGDVMQDSTTGDMIWSVAELIEYISHVVTFEPGDVIATGTPHGAGMAKGLQAEPGEFHKLREHMYSGGGTYLQPGDHLISEIEGVGRLENPVLAASD